MNELQKEIEESIKKNLPSQIGDVLRARLEKADQDEVKLNQAIKSLSDVYDRERLLIEKVNKYMELDVRNSALDARETDIASRERDQKVFEAELKMNESEKRANEMAGFVGMVFKSPIYRTYAYGNDGTFTKDQYGNNVSAYISKTTDKTTE